MILNADCGLAIENTMIYHTPEVKEQLERFGIPVLVERSSYEEDPLARMEWVKLYGLLLGKKSRPSSSLRRQSSALPHWQSSRPPANGGVFLHYIERACHRAQGQRLCCQNDRDGGRGLCVC